jgi:hypothetical protein
VDCKVYGIAIALYVSVTKSGCNRSANKIQSSGQEPAIYVTYTTLHVTIYILYNVGGQGRSLWHSYLFIRCRKYFTFAETLNFLVDRKEMTSLIRLIENFILDYLYSEPKYHVVSKGCDCNSHLPNL